MWSWIGGKGLPKEFLARSYYTPPVSGPWLTIELGSPRVRCVQCEMPEPVPLHYGSSLKWRAPPTNRGDGSQTDPHTKVYHARRRTRISKASKDAFGIVFSHR